MKFIFSFGLVHNRMNAALLGCAILLVTGQFGCSDGRGSRLGYSPPADTEHIPRPPKEAVQQIDATLADAVRKALARESSATDESLAGARNRR